MMTRLEGVVAPNSFQNQHRQRVKNTLSFIFVVIYLAFFFMMYNQSPFESFPSSSGLFAEAGHTKIKVWRGPTRGDHKHSTASFGYWFHHDGQLEGGHSHHHKTKHPRPHHNTGHYNPGLYGAHSYLHPQRQPIQTTQAPTTARATIQQLPTPSEDSGEEMPRLHIPVGIEQPTSQRSLRKSLG